MRKQNGFPSPAAAFFCAAIVSSLLAITCTPDRAVRWGITIMIVTVAAYEVVPFVKRRWPQFLRHPLTRLAGYAAVTYVCLSACYLFNTKQLANLP
jgi:hypothetical protein